MRSMNLIRNLIAPGLLLILISLAPIYRTAGTTTTKLVPALGWDIKKQGGFPVSITSDASGNIWVGTEGNGLWKYDTGKKEWTQFTIKDGLGDDCVYALAIDKLNRVWAGHLNHGVSVYNGEKWKNYGLIDGPIGDRVFAITVSSKDGDVWIGTDMGLARYSEKRRDWDYYTRASGLPSDQIECIAFDGDGRIYAGTQASGIAVAEPGDDYTKWRSLTAPTSTAPTPFGDGLASNFINCLQAFAVDDVSLIAALTPSGATFTQDGESWKFVRGQDWQTGANTVGTLPLPIPSENWLTALQSAGSHVWVGYRKAGVESRALDETGSLKVLANVEKPASVVIRDILTIPDQPPLFAAYDGAVGGLLTVDNAPSFKAAATSTNAATQPPSTAPIPTLDDAKALAARLGKLTQQLAPGEAFYLADDWRTQGDWVGRYGGSYTKLCDMADKSAAGARTQDQDYSLMPGYEVSIQLSPHNKKDFNDTSDSKPALPFRSHENETSDDLRSLYDPTLGHRRDAEDDDGSTKTDVYPESYNGPDLWVRAKVPDGVHCLSLYFQNNDAHNAGGSKYRDYNLDVFPDQQPDSKVQAAIESGEPLARTRVTDFWGGVYKQFLVCGPAGFVVRIGRNRSFGTRLQAVFLDRVTGDVPDNPGQLPGFDSAPYLPPDEPTDYHPTPLTDAAVNLWSQLDDALSLRGAINLQMPFRIWCYRAAIAGHAPAEILERWRWQISIWTPDDRKKFDDAMKAAHNAAR